MLPNMFWSIYRMKVRFNKKKCRMLCNTENSVHFLLSTHSVKDSVYQMEVRLNKKKCRMLCNTENCIYFLLFTHSVKDVSRSIHCRCSIKEGVLELLFYRTPLSNWLCASLKEAFISSYCSSTDYWKDS